MKFIFNKKIVYHIIFFSICQLSFLYAWHLYFVHYSYLYSTAVVRKIIIVSELTILGPLLFTKILDLSTKEKEKLFIDSRARFVGVILLMVDVLTILITFIKLPNNIHTLSRVVKIELMASVAAVSYISLFVTSYLFHLDLRKFSLKINVKTFFCIIIIFLSCFLPKFIFGLVNWNDYCIGITKNIPGTILRLIETLFYPAAIEEYFYRGVILSALLSFNMENWKANIIQATIFGLTHIFQNHSQGFSLQSAIFLTSTQIIFGYVFGKISLKTHSLMPSIILHALKDAFNAS